MALYNFGKREEATRNCIYLKFGVTQEELLYYQHG